MGEQNKESVSVLSPPRVGPWMVIPSNGVTRGKLEEVWLRALVSSFATRLWTSHHLLLLYIRQTTCRNIFCMLLCRRAGLAAIGY